MLTFLLCGGAGLPEEVSVTKAALRRDYAVVAFSSLDRQMRCWDISYGADLASSSDLAKVCSEENESCIMVVQSKTTVPYQSKVP